MTVMEYETELAHIWRSAVDPKGIGMAEALAEDIAAHTGEPPGLVLERMARGKQDFRLEWEQSGIDPTDASSVAHFYREQLVEAYELAEWHSGRLNGHPPLNYAHAAYLARTKKLSRVLDFGSGIGTGALCLVNAGCRVDCADINKALLSFVRRRVALRGLTVDTIDLAEASPPERTYDLVTCFDVLEHIPDQFSELRRLQSYLRPGGYLLVNLMKNAIDPDRPMHVSSAPDWLRMIRGTRMVPDWDWFRSGQDHIAQALVYRRWGRARNTLGLCVDMVQRAR